MWLIIQIYDNHMHSTVIKIVTKIG